MLARPATATAYQLALGDPVTWIVVVSSIGLPIILAAWRPAGQAMRVDSIALLRED
jgi:hypothetical protein